MFLTKNKKSPYYQLIYFTEDKRTSTSTKATTIREAKRFLQNFHYDSKPIHKKNNSSITINSFLTEYLEYIELAKSISYIRSVKLSFRMLQKKSGNIKLNQVSVRLLDKFITETYKRAPRSADLYYRTLKASFSKAVMWNYIHENPLKNIKAPKIVKTLPYFITEEEFDKIICFTPYQHLKDLFTTAFYTGMRLGEMINMQWNWINFKNNSITVKCTKNFITKSKKERLIPLSEKLQNLLLNNYLSLKDIPNEYVFNKKRNVRLYDSFISKHFKRAVRKAELDEKIHFHTLRHSFASMLVQKGVSLYVVKELLGHEDLSTTQIYSHLQKENLFDAIKLL